MGKRLYKRAKDSTPELMDAAARELEVLEARLATKLLASSDNAPVALHHHPRVVGHAAFLERPGTAPTTSLPVSPAAADSAAAAAAASGPATGVAPARRQHRRSKSTGVADVGAKGRAGGGGGGKSSHRRPRIYSDVSSFLYSSAKKGCRGDDDGKDGFAGGAGDLGGSKRKSASTFAAAEKPSAEERKHGDGGGGGTAGFLTACGFTGYRSDSMLPPLLSSSLQGEDDPSLGSDDGLQHPTLPDVGPSLSPDPDHRCDNLRRGGDGNGEGGRGHPVPLGAVAGYSMAVLPPREQNTGPCPTNPLPGVNVASATPTPTAVAAAVGGEPSSALTVGGSPKDGQQRRQALATTAALNGDVAHERAREGARGSDVPAGATAVVRCFKVEGDGGSNLNAGDGETKSVLAAAALVQGVPAEVTAAKAGAVVCPLVVPMDMDMDNDWLQVRNCTPRRRNFPLRKKELES